MRKENVVLDKSYAFAVKIVRLYQHLSNEKKEFMLSKQMLRAGTSIGSNVEEEVVSPKRILKQNWALLTKRLEKRNIGLGY